MLRGERVLLRAMTRDDLKTYWGFRQDVEIVLLADDFPPRPRSFEEIESNCNK